MNNLFIELKMYLKFLLIVALTCLTFASDNENIAANKPCSYIQKLINLKNKQEQLFYENKFEALEDITAEIGTLLTFRDYQDTTRYRFRRATNEEAQVIFGSVAQTRKIYKGVSNIMERFYFGQEIGNCKQRIKNDLNYAKHIASLTAVDSIAYGIFNNRNHPKDPGSSFEDWFNNQRNKQNVAPEFIKYITEMPDIFGDNLYKDSVFTEQLQKLSNDNWNSLVNQLGIVLDVFAPEIDLLMVFEDLVVSNGNYKGWNIHKFGRVENWSHDKDKTVIENNIEKEIYVNQAKNNFLSSIRNPNCLYGKLLSKDFIMNISFTGVVPTPSEINLEKVDHIEDVKNIYDEAENAVIAEYSFYFKIGTPNETYTQEDKFSFYLARELNPRLNKNIFSKINETIRKQRIISHFHKINTFGDLTRSAERSRATAALGSLYGMTSYSDLATNIEPLAYLKLAASMGGVEAQYKEYHSILKQDHTKVPLVGKILGQLEQLWYRKMQLDTTTDTKQYSQFLENYLFQLKLYQVYLKLDNDNTDYGKSYKLHLEQESQKYLTPENRLKLIYRAMNFQNL